MTYHNKKRSPSAPFCGLDLNPSLLRRDARPPLFIEKIQVALNEPLNIVGVRFFEVSLSNQSFAFRIELLNKNKFPWHFKRSIPTFGIIMLKQTLMIIGSKPFVKGTIHFRLNNINEKFFHNKKRSPSAPFCGLDGTRTRDLRRDRPAF